MLACLSANKKMTTVYCDLYFQSPFINFVDEEFQTQINGGRASFATGLASFDVYCRRIKRTPVF